MSGFSQRLALTQVSHGRPETRIKPGGLSKGPTISSGRKGGFPLDAEHLVDAFLLVVGLAGLADVDRASVGERESGGNEAVAAKQAAYRFEPQGTCRPSAGDGRRGDRECVSLLR